MITEPKIEARPEQHFVAIRTQVPIPFGSYLGPLYKETGDWLTARGIPLTGVPIIRYLTTDMSRKLDVEVGWTVPTPVAGDSRVSAGVFPSGNYAVMLYTGTYRGKGIYHATAALLEWADKNNVTWARSTREGVEWWDARVEYYLTDPEKEPDPKKWQTELVFLTKS
jgi:effector-binding domain-containing protein